ncbi:hypothetical protein FIBSPDRAFT_767567 [Athelia psychrophila]|uniref:Protein YTP1-like C-terminal domain-containing protein n=1 Tax=Athelia psychrophila TaxID=1759441 RepID=A0A167UVT1_9AGAM|nr:hypothetical protein FIBSPDRAFT_767567 [Fibularhizoctonia sp. CBS 109695]
MIVHGIVMSAAFFVALPAAIAMRSVKHAWRSAATCAFYMLCIIGCAASTMYTKITPNMYEDQRHSRHGYFIILAAVCLSILDCIAIVGRMVVYFRSGDRRKSGLKGFWRSVILDREEDVVAGSPAEYTGLVAEPEEYDYPKLEAIDDETEPLHARRKQPLLQPLQTHTSESSRRTIHWASDIHSHEHSRSAASDRTFIINALSPRKQYSDDTLYESDGFSSAPQTPLLHRIRCVAFGTIERGLVVGGFMQLLSGIVVYTGGCRENYINGCLAHLIKGGIFWCYGLITFARFLGSFADLGWAWNRSPQGGYVSAEFVESFVIFTYGITNTWMERFGANAGDPFTTKQLQHISIAVMFWFAGLIGMGIESKRVRKWLAALSLQSASNSAEASAEPPSYIASFNPFPALVIGVTGAAMSAHAQAYVFQVQIHALWGYLLVGFAILRSLTYCFLWLGPPRSLLPSRPPTEALGSFFLACGGLMFIFSTEELTFAAMRQGRDDMMFFLNAAVSLTCFAFCWTFCVVAFKGWLKSRTMPPLSYRNSA